MAHRRNPPEDDNESKLICDNDQMHMLKMQESDVDEYYDAKEQPSPSGLTQTLQEVGTVVPG
jgi:hypothetical protein